MREIMSKTFRVRSFRRSKIKWVPTLNFPFLTQLTCLDDKIKAMKWILADNVGYLHPFSSIS